MNTRFFILVTLIAAVSVAVYLYLHNDKRKIKQQLNHLTELAEKKEGETAVKAFTAAGKFGKLFTDPCFLQVELYDHVGEYTRKDIVDRMLMIRNMTTQLHAGMRNIEISIHKNDSAEISSILTVKQSIEGKTTVDVFALTLSMHRKKGDWLINQVVLELLEL
ncbi:MAG: hypothetical protein CSA31_01350 [Desulfobulbus propionicus]|nr:MAG: hypothetical protein CSA31_01350 [Desulfobulbus propionicus]